MGVRAFFGFVFVLQVSIAISQYSCGEEDTVSLNEFNTFFGPLQTVEILPNALAPKHQLTSPERISTPEDENSSGEEESSENVEAKPCKKKKSAGCRALIDNGGLISCTTPFTTRRDVCYGTPHCYPLHYSPTYQCTKYCQPITGGPFYYYSCPTAKAPPTPVCNAYPQCKPTVALVGGNAPQHTVFPCQRSAYPCTQNPCCNVRPPYFVLTEKVCRPRYPNPAELASICPANCNPGCLATPAALACPLPSVKAHPTCQTSEKPKCCKSKDRCGGRCRSKRSTHSPSKTTPDECDHPGEVEFCKKDIIIRSKPYYITTYYKVDTDHTPSRCDVVKDSCCCVDTDDSCSCVPDADDSCCCVPNRDDSWCCVSDADGSRCCVDSDVDSRTCIDECTSECIAPELAEVVPCGHYLKGQPGVQKVIVKKGPVVIQTTFVRKPNSSKTLLCREFYDCEENCCQA